MKITKLETIHVKPRWLFLKIHTDEGIVGLGEPVVEGRAQTVETCVREIAERYLIGQDPLRITHHWQAIYLGQFYQGGPVLTSAIAGIDQALWDIKGKFYGVPVYELLGGRTRDKIKVYGHFGGSNYEEIQASATASKAKGYTAFKTGVGGPVKFIDTMKKVQEFADRIAQTREIIGPECDLGIDFHGEVSPAMAMILIKAVEEYQPLFIEEPVLPGNLDELARVARSTYIPIATGERLFTKWQFREVLEKQAAVVLQPDLSHAGGISECRLIAGMAEASYATMAPHCPLGPIALAACFQLDAAIPNFLCQESVTMGAGYLKEPFVVENGYVKTPTKPGLGIELDEEAIAEKTFEGNWETPRYWYEDGSVAVW
ncbi:MAG: galactonate dehydratase [Clostridia bacterium]|nr:galactonate dehydratase [Clostridia bacterium]